MSGEHARRTSSGRTLRLVLGAQEPPPEPPPSETAGGTQDSDGIVLPSQRRSVAVGRHWVVQSAVGHGVTGMANQVVELLSSELLANAVLHGPEGGAIGVRVHHDSGVLRVSVADTGAQPPVVLRQEPTAASGRGMAIVEAMATRWGVEEHGDGGKTVWFELDLDDF
ncbi:ATP-binding protein [Actinotalea sp. K2]|uniref:ATP-binding protein n=1 Tax=Actinotalea sp. K2 TaxID=2939438 RepID=UPI002017C747|nr:ATP-binding protein [Actinotalea sp. K2]MCL3861410.1 ATP-binding protein [Actinotalea sp. K2]